MKFSQEINDALAKKEKVIFTTSFGMEDQVLLDLLIKNQINCDVVTIDTGRNFKETYEVWSRTEKYYGIKIKSIHPDGDELGALMKEQGPEGFYESVANRKSCCKIRKINPLKKSLQNYQTWITGLRSDQTAHRNDLKAIAYDDHFGIEKINPLIQWTWTEINEYVLQNNIPVNRLHQKSYPSIGCEPCTRAILEGEDFRAGRWWWENDHQECGLHLQK